MQSAGTLTLDCILLKLLPFEHWKLPFLPHTCVHSVTPKRFEIFFMKLHTNVKHHETKCKAKEPQLWITYFWSYWPMNIEPFEIWEWDDMQSAGSITLDCILRSYCRLNIEKWQLLPHTHVRSVTLKQFKIFSWNFIQMLSTMRRCAEHRNRNSGLHTFGVIALWTVKIAIPTTYSCLLCNIKTVWDIFMKLHINIKHNETKCKAQEPQLWIAYFWSYFPLNIELFEIFSWNCTQMLKVETKCKVPEP